MSTVQRLGSSLEVARRYDEESEGMLINVEWGAFGDTILGAKGVARPSRRTSRQACTRKR